MLMKEFALNTLFTSTNGDTDLKKEDLTAYGTPLITSGVDNNGYAGLTDKDAKIIPANTITVDMFGNTFYRDFEYKMVTHARVFALLPIQKMSRQIGLYLTAALSFLPRMFSYNNMCSWSKIQDIRIPLPTKRVFHPNYTLISELAGGGIDMSKIDTSTWKEFKLDDLFEKIPTNKLPYKAGDLKGLHDDMYCLPALTAGIENQGLSCYVPYEGATVLKNCISVSANGANTGAMFYQDEEFTVLQDSYAIRLKDETHANKATYCFLIACMQKVIKGNYDWSNKAGWERIKSLSILLPVVEVDEIDFDYMEERISELEAERISELEAERISELEAFLAVTGLDDYELTEADKEILSLSLLKPNLKKMEMFQLLLKMK